MHPLFMLCQRTFQQSQLFAVGYSTLINVFIHFRKNGDISFDINR